jgi:iron complex outermembrane receptor protein
MRPPLHLLVAITRLIRGWRLLARASLLGIALYFSIIGLALGGDVHASVKKPTNIPAQPLGAALQALAKDRNFQVVFVTEEVNSLRTPGAVGELTTEEALQQLLEGTGLRFGYLDEMTVIIVPASAGANTDALPPQSAQGTGANLPAERPRVPGLNAIVQAPASKLPEEITITGSRLHVAPAATASPLTVITQQEIEMRGFSTVEDTIVSLPQNYSTINAATTLDNSMNSINSQGLSAADLHGLGPENTLILVNGRRRAPFPGLPDIVNLNTIPAGSIDRIEIMTDGASAVYGSDAVAGVINFILKKNFEGAATQLRQALGHNGGDSVSLEQTLGHGWSSGNVTFSGRYARSNHVNSRRAGFATSNLSNIGGDDRRSPDVGQPGVVQGFGALPAGDDGTHGVAGKLSPANVAPLDGAQFPFDVVANTTSLSFDLNGEQSINSWARLYVDLTFARNTSDSLGGAPGTAGISVPVTNVYNNLGAPVEVGYVFGREVQSGLLPSPQIISNQKGLGAVLGLKIPLPRNWSLDISASHSREDAYLDARQLDTSLFAMRVSGVDEQGNPIPINQQLNLFGNGTAQSPAALAGLIHGHIPGYFADDDYATTDSALLTAEGWLLSIAGGQVRMAAGAEFRRESLNLQDDTFNSSVYLIPDPSRTVKAVFAELDAPLVGQQNRIPGIYSLDLYGAGRWEQYSFSGPFDGTQAPDREVTFGHVSPKVGLSWYPWSSLELRATYSESFRAPQFIDVFGANYFFGPAYPVVDPKNPMLGTLSPPIYGSGNPRVGPETASNCTVGLDWNRAERSRGLAVTLNYSRIDLVNRITDSSEFLSQPDVFFNLPGAVERDSSGHVTRLNFLPVNIGSRRSRNIDAQAAYDIDTRVGLLTLGLSGTYAIKLEDVAGPGSTPIVLDGTQQGPERVKAHGWVSWSRSQYGIDLYGNYSSSYVNTNYYSRPQLVAPYKTFDLTGFYNLPMGFSVNAGVRNLTNAAFPFFNNFVPWDSRRVDLRGRIFYLELASRNDLFH